MRKKLAFEIFVLLLLSDLSIKKMNNTHKKDWYLRKCFHMLNCIDRYSWPGHKRNIKKIDVENKLLLCTFIFTEMCSHVYG
jgi:hypothetical protein